MLAGLLCVCLGGLGLWLVWATVRDGQDVLVAARPIPAGHVLTADDIASVRVVIGQGVEAWPAAQPAAGQRALVDIPDGALLTPSTLGDVPLAETGARVAVVVDVGRAPVESLRVGAPVTLLGATGAPIAGIVASVPELMPDGAHHRFDVCVDWADAPQVAQWVARGQVVVVSP